MDFYRKRLLRVVPAWLIIAIPWFFYIDIINSNNWLLYLGDLTTLSFITHGDRGHWYIFGIIICYLIYPDINRLISTNSRNTLFVLLLWVLLIGVLHNNTLLFENTNVFLMRMPIFIYGSYIGCISEKKQEKKNGTLFCVVGALAFVSSIMMEGILCIRGMHYSLLARLFYTPIALGICYMSVILRINSTIYKIIAWLGGLSLELYLVHMKCTSIMTSIFEKGNLFWINILSVIVSLIICQFISLVISKMKWVKDYK